MNVFTKISLTLACFSVLGTMAPTNAHAFGLDVSPIVGYDREQKLVPTAHTSDHVVYGARVTLGVPLMSLEAEYRTGRDNESFPESDLETTDTIQKAKLGLRSRLRLSNMLSFIARGGVQGKTSRHVEESGGATTVDETIPLVYKPYAGAGLRIGLSSKIAFTAEVVAVFNKFPDMNQNEYETTAGITVHLP